MRKSKKYAPVWIALFSSGTALARLVGERYILKREWTLSWKDVQTALMGAAAGYIIFRLRQGNKQHGVLTR